MWDAARAMDRQQQKLDDEEDRMSAISNEPMMQFFAYTHLPQHLQDVSVHFHAMAEWIVVNLPRNAERTVALRKLLESKDCAVRAVLYKSPELPDIARDQPRY